MKTLAEANQGYDHLVYCKGLIISKKLHVEVKAVWTKVHTKPTPIHSKWSQTVIYARWRGILPDPLLGGFLPQPNS